MVYGRSNIECEPVSVETSRVILIYYPDKADGKATVAKFSRGR